MKLLIFADFIFIGALFVMWNKNGAVGVIQSGNKNE